MAKRLAAVLLMILMFTGCAQLSLVPQLPAPPTPAPMPTPEPRSLAVYDPAGVLAGPLEQYEQQQGVRITQAPSAEEAQLAVFPAKPKETEARDLSQSEGLIQTLAGESPCYGFSLGSSSYGYVADADQLAALLGEALSVEKAGSISANDWQSLVNALVKWMEKPAGQTFQMNGRTHKLPAQQPEGTQQLKTVFAVEESARFSGPLLSPVLATHSKTPEDFANSKDHKGLSGAVNSLYTLLAQEASSLAKGKALEEFAAGRALFCRATLEQARAASPEGKKLMVLPLKFGFDNSDLSGGLSLKELMTLPVTVDGGWLGIPAAAEPEGAQEAEGFLVWLFASEQGRALPRSQGPAPEGIANVAAGLSQSAMEEIDQIGKNQSDWTRQGRSAYTAAVLEVLKKEGVESNA